MVDYECTLIGEAYAIDEVGNETLIDTRTLVPIIAIENVFASEFYQAKSQGLKPSLRLRISNLNYDSQSQVEYMGTRYSIIRIDNTDAETISLICERKLGI